MLTDYLNLRTTAQWIGFSEEKIIPIIYGTIEISPIPYDTRGTLFVLADHPCSSVLQVVIDDFLVTNWRLVNSVDNTGHPVAFLKFTKPVTGNIRVIVTGKNLYNAKDIIADFSGENSNSLALLGHNTRSYELAGVLSDKITKRSAIDEIAQSLSFYWNAASREFGYLFPAIPNNVKPISIYEAQCESSIIDLYNKLTVRFDYNYARGDFRRAITLINEDSVKLYRLREFTYDAKWIKKSGDAYDIGYRLLSFYSQPVWNIDTSVSTIENILEGQWVSFSHTYIPITKAFCLSSVNNGFESVLKLQGVRFDTQTIKFVSQATLFDMAIKKKIVSEGIERVVNLSTQSSSDSVKQSTLGGTLEEIGNGLAELTVLDESDNPLSGALVSVDGGAKKITNGAGKVILAIGTRGTRYTITIEAQHYHPFEHQGTW